MRRNGGPIATLTVALKMLVASTFLSRSVRCWADGEREPVNSGQWATGIEGNFRPDPKLLSD
jgi:hypothetical protein